MDNNRISAEVAAEAIDQVGTHLRAIEALLPFLIALSAEERRQLPRPGDGGVAFIERALAVLRVHPQMMARDFDIDEFGRDARLRAALQTIEADVARLHTRLLDTLLLVNAETYQAALEVYAAAKRTGAGEGLDDFIGLASRRFARRPARRDDDANTA